MRMLLPLAVVACKPSKLGPESKSPDNLQVGTASDLHPHCAGSQNLQPEADTPLHLQKITKSLPGNLGGATKRHRQFEDVLGMIWRFSGD
jgi:hypothetical protein